MSHHTRRSFLKQATIGAAAFSLLDSAKGSSANSELVVGLIGCGGRGQALGPVFQCVKGVRIGYVCDPDRNRAGATAERLGIDSQHAVQDLRRVLDERAVDAVVIATPDHWHAPAAILACDAGKHVYVEKPCSHNFREGQVLVAAAQRSGRIVQHGTQSRSSPFIIDAIKSLREGIIGQVLVAKAWDVQRRDNIGHGQSSTPPAELDYDLWIGPAPMVPYQANRSHYQWHWWYDFGTGDVGNDGVHTMDYALWGLGLDEYPSRIVGLGSKYYFDDDQQFPDTATIVYEWAGPPGGKPPAGPRQLIFELRIWSTNYPYNTDSGVEFFGTKGRMFLSARGKLEIFDEANRSIKKIKVDDSPYLGSLHQENFVDAIRGDRPLNADIAIGLRSSALCHLGNIAVRTQRGLHFDGSSGQIVGDDKANAMLGRSYRENGHWAIPTRA